MITPGALYTTNNWSDVVRVVNLEDGLVTYTYAEDYYPMGSEETEETFRDTMSMPEDEFTAKYNHTVSLPKAVKVNTLPKSLENLKPVHDRFIKEPKGDKTMNFGGLIRNKFLRMAELPMSNIGDQFVDKANTYYDIKVEVEVAPNAKGVRMVRFYGMPNNFFKVLQAWIDKYYPGTPVKDDLVPQNPGQIDRSKPLPSIEVFKV